MEEKASCRYCGRELVGKPYYTGCSAYDPVTMDQIPVNFYGGFVCSQMCDVRTSIEMSSSIPGAGEAKSLNSQEHASVNRNWGLT